MTFAEIAAAVESALHPGRFFVAEGLQLLIEHQSHETCRWEIFRGHLLDASQTRMEKTFATWNVILDPPGRPIISVKYEVAEEKIYVVRYIEVYAWEAYEERGVIESRETRKWAAELVGAIDLEDEFRATLPNDLGTLQIELPRYIFLAIVGTSRLPITSLESPLPFFSLGKLGYCPESGHISQDPIVSAKVAIQRGFDACPCLVAEPAKMLEVALRAATPDQVPSLADPFLVVLQKATLGDRGRAKSLFQVLFGYVALSPFTNFVRNWVHLLLELGQRPELGIEWAADVIGYVLRHLSRHLTSYNLTSFHNAGANYPDALTLDIFVGALIELIENRPEAFAKSDQNSRLRRRAFRQAWILRRQLEGVAVPEQPTSPGENLRVLPEPFHRLSEEVIVNPDKRSKRLFEGESADCLLRRHAENVFRQSLAELSENTELRELGIGVFLDRPLGIFKLRGEVDRTPFLSYEAFSRSLAQQRLDNLHHWGLLPQDKYQQCVSRLTRLAISGISVGELPDRERPGVVSLEEARRAAADFIFVRTTTSSLFELMDFALGTLRPPMPPWANWLACCHRRLLIRTPRQYLRGSPPPLMIAFDDQLQPRFDFFVAQNDGQPIRYREWLGVEYLAEGLRVVPRE